MEINNAKLVLTTAISSPNTTQGIVPALQLALDLLNNTFKANFESLATAQKEANDLAVTKNLAEQAKIDAETKATSLTASLADKDSQIADLQTKLDTPVDITPIDVLPIDVPVKLKP
jgi:chromosome segregation ATPase